MTTGAPSCNVFACGFQQPNAADRVATSRTSEERLTANRDQKKRMFDALSHEEHEELLQHRRRRRKVLIGAESDQENSVRRGKNSDRECFRRLDNFNAACNGDLQAIAKREAERERKKVARKLEKEQKLKLTSLATSGNGWLPTTHVACIHLFVCGR
jgi:hypothetical protein